jgi:hypothetical protein
MTQTRIRAALEGMMRWFSSYPTLVPSADHVEAVIDAVEEARAALNEAGVSAWLPIASAPRDGTTILLRLSKSVSQGRYDPHPSRDAHPWEFIDRSNGASFVNHMVDSDIGPSHWMPMPGANAAFEPGSLAALLREIRPEFGAVGSRDVDVRAQQNRIDAALAVLAGKESA